MHSIKLPRRENLIYKIGNDGFSMKSTLYNPLFDGNGEAHLVEISMFGIDKVYSLIDFNKIRKFIDYYNSTYKSKDIACILSLYRKDPDSPLVKDVNLRECELCLNDIDAGTWITLFQLRNIIAGMNIVSEMTVNDEIEHDLNLEIPSINSFRFSDVNFLYDTDAPYIVKYSSNEFEFMYETPDDLEDYKGIFIHIPEFNCWQYLSKKKYLNLSRNINYVELRYCVTDHPRCFSKVGYNREYITSKFEELLQYMIYLPMDIYFSKVFDNDVRNYIENGYDAIEIEMRNPFVTKKVLLTFCELGIDTKNIFADNSLATSEFCLLKLINKIDSIKPY